MKKIYLLFFSFLFLNIVHAQVYTIETVPNPKDNGGGYVSDPDHVLKAETVSSINSIFTTLEKNTSDQVALVVVNSIGEEVPKDFVYKLFNKWGIGIKGKNNGLLILMVMDQHRVEFETGYGMEALLPDATCKSIQMTYMVPRFKEGDYDQGLLDGITATADILKNAENSTYFIEMNAVDNSDNEETKNIVSIVFFSVFGLITLISLLVKKPWKTLTNNNKASSGKQKQKNALVISNKRWWSLYVIIPGAILLLMYAFYGGENYFIVLIAALYLYFIFILLEKRIRSNNRYKKTIVENDFYGNYTNYVKAHEYWWWAAIFFPIPFLFYFVYYSNHKKALRNHPRNCKGCLTALVKLDEKADDDHLTKPQLLEEELKSVDYDVWYCGSCTAKEVLSYKNIFSKYGECKSCGTRADYLHKNVTLVSATYDSTGTGKKTYLCKYCGNSRTETYTIARLERSSSSSSGSGGSSSSFGGGSSGGGGSGSSW
jgi:uncharacterized protein